MQSNTVDYIRGRHSSDDRVNARESRDGKDEVIGPLSGAGTHVHVDGDNQRTVKRKSTHDEKTETISESPTQSEEAVSRSLTGSHTQTDTIFRSKPIGVRHKGRSV
jgi:hypothetical protein